LKHASRYTGGMHIHGSDHCNYPSGVTAHSVMLALLILSTSSAGAEPLAAFVQPVMATRLATGASISLASSGKTAALSLAPAHPASQVMKSAVSAESPDIVVEALFLLKMLHTGSPVSENLAVYNVLRSISTLQGIEYYSASRKKIRLLYEYSSLIAGPDDQTPVRDTRVDRIPPDQATLHARQKDTTFGDNRYRILLSGGPGFVTQQSTNLTRLSLGIMPVAAPGAVNVRLLIILVDEGLLFYVASSARATLVPGVRSTLEASFGNRATAVFNWFSRELTATWPRQP